jgi:beta-glucosidase
VEYVKGCDVVGAGFNEIAKAQEAARRAKIAVVVVGENEWQAPRKTGTDGEGYDVATLELTGLQLDLVKAVCETGTPTVVVLVNGRPLAIPWIAENVPAVVEAWLPGEKGGQAVAEVLFGDYNPSGRLTVTVPRHAGQLPVYYNSKPSKRYWLKEGWGKPYADLDPTPLYEFGHGLSYTEFAYSDLKIEPKSAGPGGTVRISATVKNTGRRVGAEVAQLYLSDTISSVVTPVMQLKGFERIVLEPGGAKTVTFTLTPEHLALLDRHLEWVVEPGTFEVMVGHSSKDIRLRGTFEIAGP